MTEKNQETKIIETELQEPASESSIINNTENKISEPKETSEKPPEQLMINKADNIEETNEKPDEIEIPTEPGEIEKESIEEATGEKEESVAETEPEIIEEAEEEKPKRKSKNKLEGLEKISVDKLRGRVIIINAEKSEVAGKLNLKKKGDYSQK